MQKVRSEFRRLPARIAGFLAAFGLLAGSLPFVQATNGMAADEETPPEIIAVHLRDQGYKCDKPESAKRDKVASRPDEPVWILTCENATYRVREIPDQAAKVERLD